MHVVPKEKTMNINRAKKIAKRNDRTIQYNRRCRLWEVKKDTVTITYIPPKSLKQLSEYALVNYILNQPAPQQ